MKPPEASDERLFAAYCAGDGAAYETLFRRWQEPLRRHLERMVGEPAAAEDLTIETFARLDRHRDRLRPEMPLRPWVWTIANNLARNHLRAQRLRRWLPLAAADNTRHAPPPAARGRVRERVAAAFAALPPAQRETCSLRLVAELELPEIARVTGVSLGTVKSRLFYGLKRLRTALADLAPDEG